MQKVNLNFRASIKKYTTIIVKQNDIQDNQLSYRYQIV